MADDAPFLPGLSPVAGKPVQVTFDAGRLTSDGGVLVLAEIERRLENAERLARCIEDPRAPERAVTSGAREAGRGIKTELRRQVASAGLGQRLGNSWRDRHPNRKLDAASLVYTKAPQIIRAFDEGAVVRSKRGRFVWHLPIVSAADFGYPSNAHVLGVGSRLGVGDVP